MQLLSVSFIWLLVLFLIFEDIKMKGLIRLVVGALMIIGSLLYVEVNQFDPGIQPAIWLVIGLTMFYFGITAGKENN
jgi:hypothetical protein